jgi:hypothetical protein
MSQSTRTTNAAPNARESPGTRRETLAAHPVPRTLVGAVRTVSFWTGVVTPFVYIPLLLTGLGTDLELVAFVALLALNVAGLVVGHSHHEC